ncbi:hypothetical protein EBZ37_11920, partial [bacterium]|nr:hypothetical protein [bacterium]
MDKRPDCLVSSTSGQGITEYIIRKQKVFFEEEKKQLLPMTLTEIAKALDMTESTIARA